MYVPAWYLHPWPAWALVKHTLVSAFIPGLYYYHYALTPPPGSRSLFPEDLDRACWPKWVSLTDDPWENVSARLLSSAEAPAGGYI